EARQRAHVDPAAVIETAVVKPAHQTLQIVRRLTREPLGHGVHAGARALEMTLQSELTVPLDAVRCQHPDQTPARSDAGRFDLLDSSCAHDSSLIFNAARKASRFSRR